MTFHPKFLASAIGSMPHHDIQQALDIVFKTLPEAPFWPQLSARGLNEQMEIQYSEGMPRRVIDREKQRMYFDTSGEYFDDLATFYESYLLAMDPEDGDGDCSAMAISPDFAAGLHAFEERLKERSQRLPYVKVQTTGPCSFALSIVDENKRALYYNDEFRDMVVKALAMKCRWQIRKFSPYAHKVICFVDEPILSAFGSSTYVSVHREDVVGLLSEMVDAIHTDGALAGVHCCGNTEWSILVDAGVDILNFDAYGFGETIAMYPQQVRKHLESGNSLAWGLVPTSPAIHQQSVESLVQLYERLVSRLVEQSGTDRDLVHGQSVITPSCGTGSMSPKDAEKVLDINQALSRALRQKHGF